MNLGRVWIAVLISTFAAGCGWDSGVDTGSGLAQGPIPARRSSITVDGCALEPFATLALDAPHARKFIKDVILLCAVPRHKGGVGPADPSARAVLAQNVAWLRGRGYSPLIAVSFTDETGARYDGQQTRALLAAADWRKSVADDLITMDADGYELDMQLVPREARADVTSFVSELSAAARAKGRRVGVMLPPSTSDPSDVAGGDAVDVAAVAPHVARFRVMTLDFSETTPGPTIDTGWAVDAVRFAAGRAGTTPVDVSYPLYGVDFSPAGRRLLTTLEAWGLASVHRARVERTAAGGPRFSYVDANQIVHTVFFDDTSSTLIALRAWDTKVLPADVGVLFYGLGAEDPRLFRAIAESTP